MSISGDFLKQEEERTFEGDFIKYCSERFRHNCSIGNGAANFDDIMLEIIACIKNHSKVMELIDELAFEVERLRGRITKKKAKAPTKMKFIRGKKLS